MRIHCSITAFTAATGCIDASAQVGIIALGDLPGADTLSFAWGVSADGSVVGGDSTVEGPDAAPFRWTREEGMVRIPGIPGGSFYEVGGISPSGEYFAGRYTRPGGGGALGFIWSEAMGMVSFGDLPGGREDSTAIAVSDEGVAVGFSNVGITPTGGRVARAAKWTASGGIEALPFPTAADENSSTQSLDILADGRIFMLADSGRWLYSEDTGFEFLEISEGPYRINSDGTFMAGNIDTPFEPIARRAAYWTPDTGEVLLEPYIDGTLYGTIAMSDDGSIIVGSQVDVGFLLWFDQGAPVLFDDYAAQIGLDLDGWNIRSITDISADGTTIVGSARRDEWEIGRIEAIVITIPAPGTLALAPLALLAMRRRR
ncbi:MAG: hypothetical protein AAFR76_11125 [Planctomycetota bacterium]